MTCNYTAAQHFSIVLVLWTPYRVSRLQQSLSQIFCLLVVSVGTAPGNIWIWNVYKCSTSKWNCKSIYLKEMRIIYYRSGSFHSVTTVKTKLKALKKNSCILLSRNHLTCGLLIEKCCSRISWDIFLS